MIQICTNDSESDETDAAYHLRDLMRREWPELDDSGNEIWIFVNARCPTLRKDLPEDVDLVILGAFKEPLHSRDGHALFRSLRLAVEVKDHPTHRCDYEGTKIWVSYRNDEQKDATKQNKDQCLAIKKFLRENSGSGLSFISRALWLRNADPTRLFDKGKFPSYKTGNYVVGKEASWDDFLTLICAQEYSSGHGVKVYGDEEKNRTNREAIEVFKRQYAKRQIRPRNSLAASSSHARAPAKKLLAFLWAVVAAPFRLAGSVLDWTNRIIDGAIAGVRQSFSFTAYVLRTLVKLAVFLVILSILFALARPTLEQYLPMPSFLRSVDVRSAEKWLGEQYAQAGDSAPSKTVEEDQRDFSERQTAEQSLAPSHPATLPVMAGALYKFFGARSADLRSEAAQCRREALSDLYQTLERQYRYGLMHEINRQHDCAGYHVFVNWNAPFSVRLLQRDKGSEDRFGNSEIVYQKTFQPAP